MLISMLQTLVVGPNPACISCICKVWYNLSPLLYLSGVCNQDSGRHTHNSWRIYFHLLTSWKIFTQIVVWLNTGVLLFALYHPTWSCSQPFLRNFLWHTSCNWSLGPRCKGREKHSALPLQWGQMSRSKVAPWDLLVCEHLNAQGLRFLRCRKTLGHEHISHTNGFRWVQFWVGLTIGNEASSSWKCRGCMFDRRTYRRTLLSMGLLLLVQIDQQSSLWESLIYFAYWHDHS